MNSAGASNSGPAYAQVVAAMERAKAEAAVARQEIVQRRKDLSRIKQERNSATQERNDAIREAAEWKGKCELANKMADEAVKRAEETWAMMQETKSTMQSMLDDEDKRVQAEAAASAFKTAAEIPDQAAQLDCRRPSPTTSAAARRASGLSRRHHRWTIRRGVQAFDSDRPRIRSGE